MRDLCCCCDVVVVHSICGSGHIVVVGCVVRVVRSFRIRIVRTFAHDMPFHTMEPPYLGTMDNFFGAENDTYRTTHADSCCCWICAVPNTLGTIGRKRNKEFIILGLGGGIR